MYVLESRRKKKYAVFSLLDYLASPFVPLLTLLLMYKKALISTTSNCAVVKTGMDALRVRCAFPILIAFESTYYVVHKLHKVANDYFSLFQ